MDAEYMLLKQGLKTPARLYRGLWILPLILVAFVATILIAISVSSTNSRNNQAFVKEATLSPQVGDVFQVNHSQDQTTYYTWYKITRVTTDSVYVRESKEHPPGRSEWDEVPTEESAYNAAEMPFSLKALQSMEMFSMDENGQRAFGLIFGVFRAGELTKKY